MVSRFINKKTFLFVDLKATIPKTKNINRLTGVWNRSSFISYKSFTSSKKRWNPFAFTQRFTRLKSLFDTAQLSATLDLKSYWGFAFASSSNNHSGFTTLIPFDCELECFFSFLLDAVWIGEERKKRLSFSRCVFCHLILDSAQSLALV